MIHFFLQTICSIGTWSRFQYNAAIKVSIVVAIMMIGLHSESFLSFSVFEALDKVVDYLINTRRHGDNQVHCCIHFALANSPK